MGAWGLGPGSWGLGPKVGKGSFFYVYLNLELTFACAEAPDPRPQALP